MGREEKEGAKAWHVMRKGHQRGNYDAFAACSVRVFTLAVQGG